jgi:hypothetical protein
MEEEAGEEDGVEAESEMLEAKAATVMGAAADMVFEEFVEPTYVQEAALTLVEHRGDAVPMYADAAMYLGYPTLRDAHGATGYAMIDDVAGKRYFAVYNPDGSLYLRSAGFDDTDTRDAAFAAVQRNIVRPEQYRILEEGDQFVYVLTDEDESEIARSVEYDSFTEAFLQTPTGRTRTEGVTMY